MTKIGDDRRDDTREFNGGALQRQAIEQQASGQPLVEFLRLLGREGYIAKWRATLISGYHKTGKSELLTRVVEEWPAETVLWLTEEARTVWGIRLAGRPLGAFDHVTLVYAIGMGQDAMLARIREESESVVIIDTMRSLLGLEDERDNSEVARALTPFIAACNRMGKTLIAVHADRKSGGEFGQQVSGAGAFIGVVDAVLMISRDGPRRTRRVLSGLSRNFDVPDLLYELTADGSMQALGSPAEVTLPEVKQKVLAVMTTGWETTKTIYERLEPRPSKEQFRLALNALALPDVNGDFVAWAAVERDPGMDMRDVRGKSIRWRLQPNLPSYTSLMGGQVFSPPAEAADNLTSNGLNPMVGGQVEKESPVCLSDGNPPYRSYNQCLDCLLDMSALDMRECLECGKSFPSPPDLNLETCRDCVERFIYGEFAVAEITKEN